jgi:uncharacterized membrane protein
VPTPRPEVAPSRSAASKRMHPLLRAFLRGLLIVVPAAVTVWLVWTVFVWIDQLFRLDALFGRKVPGLGLALALIAIAGLGFLASNVIAQFVLEGLDHLFTRTPLVRLIYTSLRDLIDAFVGEKKRFDTPVLVAPFGEHGALVPGFVTRKELQVFDLPDHVAVYLPQAYNFAGQVIAVPRKSVRKIESDSTEVMTFIVSGGVSGAGSASSTEVAGR